MTFPYFFFEMGISPNDEKKLDATLTAPPVVEGTQRNLEARHIQMIAIGGTSK
jgi:amino acid permease